MKSQNPLHRDPGRSVRDADFDPPMAVILDSVRPDELLAKQKVNIAPFSNLVHAEFVSQYKLCRRCCQKRARQDDPLVLTPFTSCFSIHDDRTK